VTYIARKQLARDAEETRERILAAVGRIIVRDGLAAVGINALAREAGADKVLIYRYFGDLDGVYSAFASQSDFWWTLDEMLSGIDPKRLSLANAIKLVLHRHSAAIRKRPVTLAVLAAELANRTPLVVVLESLRERRAVELNRWLAAHYTLPRSTDLAAVSMLLGVAVNYLAARARKIRVMSGVPIKTDDDWERLLKATDTIIDAVLPKSKCHRVVTKKENVT
jgi:AcrR family transcriptional regulator